MSQPSHLTSDQQLLAQLRKVNEAWANPLVHTVCERFEALLKESNRYHSWDRSINEALNSGDGSYYRP